MTIFELARLPRVEAIALYLRVSGLDHNPGRDKLPDFLTVSRDQLAANIWREMA